jgi:PTS system mannose-specific IIA component
MTGLVLVTHAGLAGALLHTAELIVGRIDACEKVEVDADERSEQIMAKVVAAVGKVSAEGAIIMTDLFGGTPSNMAMPFLKDDAVEVLTGVNLPMIIEFCSKRARMGVPELAVELQRCGREGIIIAGEFLKK